MSGRYGTDALGKFTVILYLILVVLQMFLLRTPFMLGIGRWIYNSVLLLFGFSHVFAQYFGAQRGKQAVFKHKKRR